MKAKTTKREKINEQQKWAGLALMKARTTEDYLELMVAEIKRGGLNNNSQLKRLIISTHQQVAVLADCLEKTLPQELLAKDKENNQNNQSNQNKQ